MHVEIKPCFCALSQPKFKSFGRIHVLSLLDATVINAMAHAVIGSQWA